MQVMILTEAAEEAKRITGQMVPIDAAPGHPGELAFTLRFLGQPAHSGLV